MRRYVKPVVGRIVITPTASLLIGSMFIYRNGGNSLDNAQMEYWATAEESFAKEVKGIVEDDLPPATSLQDEE